MRGMSDIADGGAKPTPGSLASLFGEQAGRTRPARAMRPSANFRQFSRSATLHWRAPADCKHETMYPRLHFIGVLAATFVFGGALPHTAWPQTATTQSPAPKADSAPIPPAQLDALVAPIALYPDPLLAQTLAASTYPLEIIQLQQWLAKNAGLKGDALKSAVEKQSWDPSVQALAALPDVVKRLSDDIQWTTDLGNAFLAQQKDVMDAVQRMRAKAQEKGALKSNEQQVVQTKTIEQQQVIVIEQANPRVVYVTLYQPPPSSARYRNLSMRLSTIRRSEPWPFHSGSAWRWAPGWAAVGAGDLRGGTAARSISITTIHSCTQ